MACVARISALWLCAAIIIACCAVAVAASLAIIGADPAVPELPNGRAYAPGIAASKAATHTPVRSAHCLALRREFCDRNRGLRELDGLAGKEIPYRYQQMDRLRAQRRRRHRRSLI